MSRFISEAAMLRHLVAELQHGWDVYGEVKIDGHVADIVAVESVSPRRAWVIEGKLSFGFDVLGQALRWLPYGHMVSIAVPYTRNSGAIARRVAAAFGVGVLAIHESGVIDTVASPTLLRCPPMLRKLRARLVPEQLVVEGSKWCAPGERDGARFSPWAKTCRDLECYVRNTPGTTLVDAMRGIAHHYPTDTAASSAMSGWLNSGRVVGVEMRKEAGRLRLYPRGEHRGWDVATLTNRPQGLNP